jgi:hypothetical protein
MRFEDTKVFLANRGAQHWGDRSEVIRSGKSRMMLSFLDVDVTNATK